MHRSSLTLSFALLLLAAPALAQAPDTLATVRPDPTPRMFAGGLVGALVGGVAGAVVGAVVEAGASGDCNEWCGVAGGAGGFLIGETLGLSVGVHLGNEKRGNLALTALAAGTVFAAGIWLSQSLPTGVVVIAIPVTQLITATEVQRRTARRD